MKRILIRFSFAISFVIVFSGILHSQRIPDYSDRNSIFNLDSLNNSNLRSDFLTATEGFLDPSEYFVGPGDKLIINIRGVLESEYPLIIDHEGKILLPKIGMVDLKNLNLAAAKEKIIKTVLKYFKDVEVNISLIDFRKIKVNLIGNVSHPSSFILAANTRLMDLLVHSNAVLPTTDLRNIKIIDNSSNVKFYDLLAYLRLAEKINNPYLREGDIVQVMVVDHRVSVYGSVMYPGNYEFTESDTADRLIQIAGGLTKKAETDTLEFISFDANGENLITRYYSFDEINSHAVKLHSGDKIVVREKPNYLIDRLVNVSGYVKHPGYYKIIRYETTLKELLLNEAGGFLENASLKDAYVIRTVGDENIDPEFERLKTIPRADMTDDEYDYFKTKSRERKGKMVVDFEKLFLHNDANEDLVLKRGDEIIIPEAVDYISVLGQIVNPGNIIYKSELGIEQYIELAGGFGWRAVKGDVRLIKHNSGEWIEEDDVEEIEPGDIIWVPEETPPPKFWETFTNILIIVGQLATVITAVVAIMVASRN
ncbi:MAG: SLBB domain-containing protein [bacterium]